MRITWYGTAAVSVETSSDKIIFDPFVPMTGSVVDVRKEDFEGFSDIFVTHGHPDHICSIPDLLKDKEGAVYCTKTPAATLKKMKMREDAIHPFGPGDKASVGGIEIQAFQGRHIVFDKPLVKRTVFSRRVIKYFYNVPKLICQLALCQENGEILAYLIKAEGKSILLLGSLGLDPEVSYPEGVDALVLPYQGATDLVTPAKEIIERIRPRRVVADHFDDTFPPVSNTIPTDDLAEMMRADHPEIELTIPKYKEAIEI